MGATAAIKMRQVAANLADILSIELFCAAQGVDFRAPLATSAPLQRVVSCLRTQVATMGDDRYLAPDLAAAAALIASGALAKAAGLTLPPL